MANDEWSRVSFSYFRRDIIFTTVDMTTGAILGIQTASVEHTVGTIQHGTTRSQNGGGTIDRGQELPGNALETTASEDSSSSRSYNSTNKVNGTFGIFMLLLLAVPIAMMVIGGYGLNDCPQQRFIPIWLIVGGATFFSHVFALVCYWFISIRRSDDDTVSLCFFILNVLVVLFHAAWFIVGCVWVYPVFPLDPSSNPTCDVRTYYTAFWVLTLTIIFVVFTIFMIIDAKTKGSSFHFKAGYSFSILFIGAAILMIVVGGGNCPHLPNLPGWLLGGGIIFLVEFALLVLTTKRGSGENSCCDCRCWDYLKGLGILALAAWAIYGAFYIYGSAVPVTNGPTTDTLYCDLAVYAVSFIVTSLVFVVVGLPVFFLVFISCCCSCCCDDD